VRPACSRPHCTSSTSTSAPRRRRSDFPGPVSPSASTTANNCNICTDLHRFDYTY
jgi:hypothetical protein